MGLFDDIKAKADANGDGKVTAADLEALKAQYGDQAGKLDELKAKADANGDGKVDLADLGGLKDMASNATKQAGGLFDKLTGMFKK